MQDLVQRLAGGPETLRLSSLLDRIAEDDRLHARFLNTLSYLEYVGARKIFKSRQAEGLDLEGLQHALEETGHAVRLKRLAVQLAGDESLVSTYAPAHMLAGPEAEAWIQHLDRAAEQALADLPEARRPFCNYLLTSAAVEIRAEAFYPLYERRVVANGVPVSVAGILRDETRHLAAMEAGLSRTLPEWKSRLERVLESEPSAFGAFLDALETGLPAAAPTPK